MWYAVWMNEVFPIARHRPATQAAEGLPRWRWTVAEVERMAAAGYFNEYDRFELLGGEIVPMSPKGRRHEIVRGKLAYRFTRLASEDVFVVSGAQFNLADDTYVEPDILVHPAEILTPDVRGGDALLVVEVADTSLAYDLKTKAPLYASCGVREYWVINAVTLMTAVHRQPSGNSYAFMREIAPDTLLVPTSSQALAVSLDALALQHNDE
jgi:Uma2 family endonuclease